MQVKPMRWAVAAFEAREQAQWVLADGVEIRNDDPAVEALAIERAAEPILVLLRRAMTDSCTTDGGPGCFFCDTEDEHADDCEAVKAMDVAQ